MWLIGSRYVSVSRLSVSPRDPPKRLGYYRRRYADSIKAFQSATNVALDLDDRPMPKIITLPRRRRRRVPGAPGAAGPAGGVAGAAVNAPASDAVPAAVADTPEGNAAAVAAAEAASRERERMLAEDQTGSAERN